jgi:predicted alpha/beta superfamily hydrolase
MQIPTTLAVCSLRERIRPTCVEMFTRRMTMDEKRIARLFGLTLGGLFVISLILSAIAI